MSGAFQTSREIFNNPIWKNIVDFRLFFLIYGRAVFSEDGVRLSEDLILNRGEWCRSIRKIQEDLTYVENRQIKTYSTSVISRCIKRLEESQRIRTRMHELGTVFTVVNYESYQGFGGYKKDNVERNLEQSGNSRGTVGEQSGNNNKNDMNEENAKEEREPLLEIKNFRLRYSESQLNHLDNYFEMIRHTRRSGKISSNVVSDIYKKFDTYPTICVEYAIRTHYEYSAHHSKQENYTIGILSKADAAEAAKKLGNVVPFKQPERKEKEVEPFFG